jgi:hypothetical protein
VTVRIVLDTSALAAYSRLSTVAVGELISIVEEEDDASLVGVPAASFVAAHRVLDPDDRERLVDLATMSDGVTVILPLLGADAVEVAELEAAVSGGDAGDYDNDDDGIGHAIVAAGRLSATLVTYRGDTARRWLDDNNVLDL